MAMRISMVVLVLALVVVAMHAARARRYWDRAGVGAVR